MTGSRNELLICKPKSAAVTRANHTRVIIFFSLSFRNPANSERVRSTQHLIPSRRYSSRGDAVAPSMSRAIRPGSRGRALLFGGALIAAASACRSKPASVEDLYTARMLGLSYLQRNQLPEAESQFKKLTELAPDDPLGYAELGLTYLQAGRYAEAEKELRKARELDPANTEIGLALARLYALTGRSAEARTTLERLRRDTTRNAHVLYALAELDAQQHDSASVRRYEDGLRDVLAVAPANLVARLKLVDAFARRGEADSAIRYLEEVRRTPPELPREARTNLDSSIQLLRAGNVGQARPALDRFFGLVE